MTPGQWELTDEKYMRAGELRRLFDDVELAARRDREKGRTTWPRRFALLALMRYAGLRVSEVAALRVGDVELDTDMARVTVHAGKYRKQKKGKAAKPDYAPLAAEAIPIMRDYLAAKETWGEPTNADAWLFPSRDGHIQKRAIQHAFKKALELAGLPLHYSPHALRHSYGVYLYRHTKDLRLTQKALRHRRSTTTEVYADVLPEDVFAGVNGAFAEDTTTDRPAQANVTFKDPEAVAAAKQRMNAESLAKTLEDIFRQAGVDSLDELQKKLAGKKPTKPKKERKTPPKPPTPPPPTDRRKGEDRRHADKPVKAERRRGTSTRGLTNFLVR